MSKRKSKQLDELTLMIDDLEKEISGLVKEMDKLYKINDELRGLLENEIKKPIPNDVSEIKRIIEREKFRKEFVEEFKKRTKVQE